MSALARVDPAAARRAAPHHRDQKIALDDRRAARPKEVLHDAEPLGGVDLPQQAAIDHVFDNFLTAATLSGVYCRFWL